MIRKSSFTQGVSDVSDEHQLPIILWVRIDGLDELGYRTTHQVGLIYLVRFLVLVVLLGFLVLVVLLDLLVLMVLLGFLVLVVLLDFLFLVATKPSAPLPFDRLIVYPQVPKLILVDARDFRERSS